MSLQKINLIQHLYHNYARISVSNMSENDARLRAVYNAEKSLEIIIERLNKCVDFVAA